jgi:circadian clock protein KaiC
MSEKDKQLATGELCHSGVTGLDNVLCGGFPRRRLYLIRGRPGTGKTTLALQFLLDGLAAGEIGLYVTLSETREELEVVAASHGWSLAGIDLIELSSIEQQLKPESQTTLLQPAEMELTRTMRVIEGEIERLKPHRIVFDSLAEMRLMAQSPLRYRRQILALKSFLTSHRATVLLLDDASDTSDHQLESIAHGVVQLEHLRPEYGAERRRMHVMKLRGVRFRGGYHDYVIETGGVAIFPRLVAAEHRTQVEPSVASSGVAELDALLHGGLDRGTSTLILGPAGSGKSTIATQFLAAAAARGERGALFMYDENKGTLLARANSLQVGIAEPLEQGMIHLQQIDAAELAPGQFISLVRDLVEQKDVKFIVIDSLNGFLNSMPEERFLVIQLHELLAYLSQKGVTTLMVMAQHGMVGTMQSPVDLTYLADAVMLLRFFEHGGAIKKAISVLKKRSGGHEETIRELRLVKGTGIVVGEPLTMFRGVLTGVPTYTGPGSAILEPADTALPR